MADTSLFGRLRRLFSTDVVIRNVGGNQLKVTDSNQIQSLGQLQTNSLFDRFNKLYSTVGGVNYVGDVGRTNYIQPNNPGASIIYKYNLNPRIALRGSYSHFSS